MKEVVQFLSQVRIELSKVAWPKYEEWVGSTIVVLVLVAAFSVYLFAIDTFISQLARKVFAYYGL